MLTMNLFGNKHFIVIDTTNHAVAYVQMQYACTFTMDELAKTLYKCNKIVQSPREFKETFPRYFCLKERMNLQYPTHSTAFKLSWSIFQLVVLVVQLQFIWEPHAAFLYQTISQGTSIVLYEMYIGRSLKKNVCFVAEGVWTLIQKEVPYR